MLARLNLAELFCQFAKPLSSSSTFESALYECISVHLGSGGCLPRRDGVLQLSVVAQPDR